MRPDTPCLAMCCENLPASRSIWAPGSRLTASRDSIALALCGHERPLPAGIKGLHPGNPLRWVLRTAMMGFAFLLTAGALRRSPAQRLRQTVNPIIAPAQPDPGRGKVIPRTEQADPPSAKPYCPPAGGCRQRDFRPFPCGEQRSHGKTGASLQSHKSKTCQPSMKRENHHQ